MLIDLIRKTLRVTTTAYDDEIQMHIASALKELDLAGIVDAKLSEGDLDPIIIQAVSVYCKLHFSRTLPEEAQKLEDSFNAFKSKLRISSEYGDWSD